MKNYKHRYALLLGLLLALLSFPSFIPINNPFDTKALDAIDADIRNDLYGKISSLIIYKGPRIVYEKYYGFSQFSTLHPISSVTKSITSLVAGMCIDKGYIPSLDVKIKDYFPEYKEIFDKDTLKQQITLRHLLTQTSGLQWDEWNIHYSYAGNPLIEYSHSRENWCGLVLKQPMSTAPGCNFCYNSFLSELIKEIISRSSGVPFQRFVEDSLFKRMNISTYHWDTYQGNGVPAWGGLFLSTRDMAKFGTLILNKGVWGYTRVVSKAWIESSIAPLADAGKVNYGLHWWVGKQPDGNPLVFAAGYGDQYVYVAPDKGIVIAFNGQNFADHKWTYNQEELITNVLKAYKNN